MTRKYLMIFWFFVLMVPMIQSCLKIFKGGALKGTTVLAAEPDFSFSTWFDASFQEAEEKYLNDNFGFRSDMVRLHNQLYFSFFDKAYANDVVIGKNGYLYEKVYIDAYYGANYAGDSLLNERIRKIAVITDTLAKKKKALIVVLAPGKARYFPQYIPDRLRKPVGKSNYEKYARDLPRFGVPTFDCTKYFEALRDTSRYPLFARYGTHWSVYGGSLVQDSLVKIIARETRTPLPEVSKILLEDTEPQGTDSDIGDVLNLIFKQRGDLFAYPFYTVDTAKVKPKLRLISIGDSFYWTIYSLRMGDLFADQQFWYYYNELWPEIKRNDGSRKMVSDLDLRVEIANNDVFVLMCSEANMANVGFSFVDQVYDIFCGK